MFRSASIFRFSLPLLLVVQLSVSASVPASGPAAFTPAWQQPAAAVDEGTLLLEYLLGEKSSVLWAITPDSAQLFELPGRAEIEAAAQRVYELLTARIPRENETNLVAFRRAAQAETQYPAAALALSQMILGPVADQLGKKRLLIVADGALHYIPFAALPDPVGSSQLSVASRKAAIRRQPTTDNRQPTTLDCKARNRQSAVGFCVGNAPAAQTIVACCAALAGIVG